MGDNIEDGIAGELNGIFGEIDQACEDRQSDLLRETWPIHRFWLGAVICLERDPFSVVRFDNRTTLVFEKRTEMIV